MAKVTIANLQKEIAELEERLKRVNDVNSKLNKEITEMQDKADNSFLNSALHKMLLNENRTLKAATESKDRIISTLENKCSGAEKEIDQLKSVHKCNEQQKIGRKERFTDEQKAVIKMHYIQKEMSVRKLAEFYNCSVGLIHKIIKEGE